MKLILKPLAFYLLSIFALASCQEEENIPNPLVANAGEETVGLVDYSTLLDGSLSTNSTGKPMAFRWEVTSKPSGALVTIEGQDQMLAKFYGDLPGQYTVKLTITYLTWSDTDFVQIILSDDAEPNLLAVAGEDRSQEIGESLGLNGSASIFEGGGVQILWENVIKPENSTVTIQNPTLLETSFQPSKAGEYVFKLTLTSGLMKSQDLVKINVLESSSNQVPILINADITQDRTLSNVFVTDSDKLDYLVTKDVAVRGAKLTIEPGVRIGFEEGTGLVIAEDGSLKAYTQLIETLPIVFQGKEAQKGYWDGIQILSQNPAEYINGITIRDAGKLGYGIKIGSGAKLYMTFSNVHHNEGVGLHFEIGSNITEFKSNKVFDNNEAPIRIPASALTQLFWDVDIQGGPIQVTEGKILSGTENFWPNFGVGYAVQDDLVIYNGSTLVLSTGTKLTMANDKAIRVISGSVLRILGAENSPVIIEGQTKSMGAWRGVYIENSQGRSSSIGFTEIRHAGSNAIAGQDAATIKLGNGGNLKLFNSILDQGKGIGLEAVASNMNLEMKDNTIKNHLNHPISVTAQMVEHLDYLTRFENNAVHEVAVDGFKALAKDGGEIIWKGFAQQIPFVIKGLGKDLLVQSGMRIKAGVIINMQDGARIDVQDANGRLAYLNIEGVEGNPVIIQGVNDIPGFWYGITYSTNHAQNVINHAIIGSAGKTMSNNFSAAITVDNVPQGSLLLQNTRIIKSGQHGVAITKQFSDYLRTTNVTFEEIAGEEIYVWE